MAQYSNQTDTGRHLRQILVMNSEKPESTSISVGYTNSSDSSVKKKMRIFGVNFTSVPRLTQFLLLSSATFFFYLIYGYLQELIFQLEEFRPHGWYLTLVQFAYYTGFGLCEMIMTGDRTRRIPLTMYFLLAFLTVATMGLSNTSVGYLNYPTQVIFKSCKLIPVMIGGIFIQGKKYSLMDVVAVLLMVIGLILFTLADNRVSPTFNTYGVILIMLALCADGAIGNCQEKAMQQHSAGNSEVIFYSYSIGFLYILFGILISGDITSAVQVCNKYPMKTYGYGLAFSISGYLGLYVVLTLVKSFGALVAVTVTTCRKAVTIALSFLFFTKPFTYQYVWSSMIVVLGIYLNIYSKNRVTWNRSLLLCFHRLCECLGIEQRYSAKSIAETVV